MEFTILLFALAAPLVAQTAQQIPADATGYGNVLLQVPGIYMVPAANAPFTATEHVLIRQKTADGGERLLQTTTHIARASSGITYSERRVLWPESFHGEARLIEGQIYDPNAMRGILYDPTTHIARQVNYTRPRPLTPGPTAVSTQPHPGVVETDLGARVISGVPVQGLRRVRTMAAAQTGTGKDIVITDEFWYAPSLSIYLSIRHSDPRTGEQEIDLSEIGLTEPDGNRFRVPDDYKVIDETPVPAPVKK